MEVCGGIGYIEEWSDVCFVCDVYLGFIWEGMSNIVVFDIVCVVKCEGVLELLCVYFIGMFDGVMLLLQSDVLLCVMFDCVCGVIVKVVEDGSDELVCQVGFVLYYIIMVIFMVVEGVCLVLDYCWLVFVYLVLCYKLLLVDLLVLFENDDVLLCDVFVKQCEVLFVLVMQVLLIGDV